MSLSFSQTLSMEAHCIVMLQSEYRETIKKIKNAHPELTDIEIIEMIIKCTKDAQEKLLIDLKCYDV
jgi:hypothetical protein